MTTTPLWTTNEWNWDLIHSAFNEIYKIGINDLKLNIYQNSFEVISSDQMIELYTTVAMPIYYNHWSFGKQYIQQSKNYKKGMSGLAFEIVSNTNPCINYIMEDNSMTTQALVIAHAGFGHNHFFKNNYLFKQWTDASSIIDYLSFAKDYISKQELLHGQSTVEKWLDSCHALSEYGVDRYKRPGKLSLEKEKSRQLEREKFLQSQVSEMYKILPNDNNTNLDINDTNRLPSRPEENLLYFFEKYSPDIQSWQREILRIVRKISQYFRPQGETKVFNEGFATLTHYDIMNKLHEKGLTTVGSHLEFLDLHTSVITQLPFTHKHYNGINPYSLGFAMLKDIQRMTSNPTKEDLEWFPVIKTSSSQEIILDAVENFRDESFIRQWLSPQVIRDFKFISLLDSNDLKSNSYEITNIHNSKGYEEIREKLADQYLRAASVPHLEIVSVDKKSRVLYIQYQEYNGRKLDNIHSVVPHLEKLWGGYPVVISDQYGNVVYSK